MPRRSATTDQIAFTDGESQVFRTLGADGQETRVFWREPAIWCDARDDEQTFTLHYASSPAVCRPDGSEVVFSDLEDAEAWTRKHLVPDAEEEGDIADHQEAGEGMTYPAPSADDIRDVWDDGARIPYTLDRLVERVDAARRANGRG